MNTPRVDKDSIFSLFLAVANNREELCVCQCFFSFCGASVVALSYTLFPAMSNPARSQQRFPFRTMVRVHKNLHAKLPPIAPAVPAEVPREVAPVKPVVQETKAVVKSSTPPFDPKDFWVQLHRHIASEPASNADNHGNQRTPNKVVRIFVSSTFTDFFSEREVLIKKVVENSSDLF